MSWWVLTVDPDQRGPARRSHRSRWLWCGAVAVLVTCAAIAGFEFWRASISRVPPGPSWAPSSREAGGLRTISTASHTEFSLYTAHGAVHFLPGMDLGATTPGHLPGELAITSGDYARWLHEMGLLGVRAIRIYTIHPPAFYTALANYDHAHPTAPIYLVQGVYLPNSVYLQTGNMYNQVATRTFRQELRDAAAAVHGTLVRGPTSGRASGHWTADVSPWTAGWIIGVEWDPQATLSTNRHNPRAPAVRGTYFYSTPNASPAERWLAARMNDMATAIASTGWTAPIAFANWPTTDPLRHSNEPNPQEDLVGVDADHVLPTSRWPGGTFASFHAYPYYPDFLRYQKSYQQFMIDGHADPYAGYLHALKVHFRGVMPLMITEFGVPSSLGSAHTGTLDRSQGNHSEAQAMRMDAAMLIEMRQLGLAGGFIFEWTNEWYKQTWNTQLHQRPLSRLQLWSDEFTNEQYFGVVATDPLPNGPPATIYNRPQAAPVRHVTAWTDASYIHLAIRFARKPRGPITLGLDAIPTIAGQPPPGSADHRADFALIFDPQRRTGQAWVRDQLDPDQLDYKRIPVNRLPHAPGWEALELITDRPEVLPLTHQYEAMEFQDAGLLRYGSWNPARANYQSQALWEVTGPVLAVRIPWAMAGLSDPSSHQALLPQGHYHVTSVTIAGIGLTVAAGAGSADAAAQSTGTVQWRNWHTVRYRERIKPGVSALRRAFTTVTRHPAA